MPEEVQLFDENTRKSMKLNKLIVLLMVLLITFPTIPFLLYRYGVKSAMATNEHIEFEIKEGYGVSQIANDLVDAGLINSPTLFKIYVKLNKLDTTLQAGSYTIPPRSSISDLAYIFQYGRNDVVATFIEGWRVEQLGLYLEDKIEGLDYKTFVETAREKEGYLFPDTYILHKDESQEDILALLSDNFDKKTADLLTEENLERIGLTKRQAVILASLVEREVANNDDKRIIAGIMIKRLKEDMRLEVDATTQYAVALEKHCSSSDDVPANEYSRCVTGLYPEYLEDIEWWPKNITRQDLDTENPYNTRAVSGLPPAPISSFGRASLNAVVNYEATPYYFYLTDNTGTTHFSETYEEHYQKVLQYLN